MTYEDIADEVRCIAQQCAWNVLNRKVDEIAMIGDSLTDVSKAMLQMPVIALNEVLQLQHLFFSEYKAELRRHH